MYDVLGYSSEKLASLLAEYSAASDYVIEQKNHLWYLQKYLQAIGARTIVVEKDYVDRDYLEDYAAYYVRSFTEYSRYCSRLHFFSNSFTKPAFKNALCVKNSRIINEKNYLGYIVLKPLPKTIIGRSCLRTYSPNQDRIFPINRQYKVNLFGKELRICALAYQEQDSTVAACASTAIWSAFQQTGALFHHNIPSPVEITRAATKHFPFANRHFPNKGLSLEQMAHAIRNVGLEPLLASTRSTGQLKSLIYAYLSADIPLVLGFQLKTLDIPSKTIGKHAVCVLGYRMDQNSLIQYSDARNFYMKSSRISGIYVHDDQVGPYAKMEFRNDASCTLTSSFGQREDSPENHYAVTEVVLAPLRDKIRISHDLVLDLVVRINSLISLIDKVLGGIIGILEWDISLSYSNKIKSQIATNNQLSRHEKSTIITTHMPKYVWHVCGVGGSRKFEFLLDATDIDQGPLLISIHPHSGEILGLLKQLHEPEVIREIEDIQLRRFLDEVRSLTS